MVPSRVAIATMSGPSAPLNDSSLDELKASRDDVANAVVVGQSTLRTTQTTL